MVASQGREVRSGGRSGRSTHAGRMCWASGNSTSGREPNAARPACYCSINTTVPGHTQLLSTIVFTSHGKMKQFNLNVVVQSLDLYVDNLAFFHSFQSDVSLVFKQNRRDLLNAVEECWKAYPVEKMNSVWSCLYTSIHGVLESSGDNNYPRHRGFRATIADDNDSKFQHVARRVILTAENHPAELQRIEANADTSQESSENEVISCDESDWELCSA